MAASSSSPSSPDSHHPVGPTSQPQDGKPKRPHHLQIHVPVVACIAGCFRPSPTSAGGGDGGGGGGGGERPTSPSLIRSPSAWIRAKGQSFGSTRHARQRSGDFQYDARSHARNFDEGNGDAEDAAFATAGSFQYRCFSSRLPTSPPPPLPSHAAVHGNASEPRQCDHGFQ